MIPICVADMKRTVYLKSIFYAFLIFLLNIQAVFSQTSTSLPVPPPVAIPEGNMLTAAAIVGYGMYTLWKQGRRPG